jgi:hypothetical protein
LIISLLVFLISLTFVANVLIALVLTSVIPTSNLDRLATLIAHDSIAFWVEPSLAEVLLQVVAVDTLERWFVVRSILFGVGIRVSCVVRIGI